MHWYRFAIALGLGSVSLAAQTVPADALEMVTGAVRNVDSPVARKSAVDLLERARSNYALRNAGQAYRLETSFVLASGGATDHDGAWTMEDVFDPALGVRWSARSEAGDSITRLTVGNVTYPDGSLAAPSLRLQEVRAALFRTIPSPESLAHDTFRTSTAMFRGAQLTCVLIAGARRGPVPASGRSWEEAEQCIDTRTGLLQLSSQVPGRYIVYDYAGQHGLPREITVFEAGQAISKITVNSLTEISAADPALFEPAESMKAHGEAVAMGEAQKISRVFGVPAGAKPGADSGVHVVCVFGLVTPSGQLVEAHSLQPSDPNSDAALDDAKGISFLPPGGSGGKAEQHFVFIIDRFYAPKSTDSAY